MISIAKWLRLKCFCIIFLISTLHSGAFARIENQTETPVESTSQTIGESEQVLGEVPFEISLSQTSFDDVFLRGEGSTLGFVTKIRNSLQDAPAFQSLVLSSRSLERELISLDVKGKQHDYLTKVSKGDCSPIKRLNIDHLSFDPSSPESVSQFGYWADCAYLLGCEQILIRVSGDGPASHQLDVASQFIRTLVLELRKKELAIKGRKPLMLLLQNGSGISSDITWLLCLAKCSEGKIVRSNGISVPEVGVSLYPAILQYNPEHSLRELQQSHGKDDTTLIYSLVAEFNEALEDSGYTSGEGLYCKLLCKEVLPIASGQFDVETRYTGRFSISEGVCRSLGIVSGFRNKLEARLESSNLGANPFAKPSAIDVMAKRN